MIYLLCFAGTPLAHAKHYIGFSENAHTLPRRIAHHRSGTGARITQVLAERNIQFQVAEIWEGDRTIERRLHKHGKTRICPLCSAKPYKPTFLKQISNKRKQRMSV
jgi:hypothetical protein